VPAQHTNNELLHFLKKVDREVPKGLAVHVITDNYGTRGHENVQAWLAKHPRFHFPLHAYFELMAQPGGTVGSGSSPKKPYAGACFRSVPDLVAAIYEYLDAHNSDPKPFRVDRQCGADPGEGAGGRVSPQYTSRLKVSPTTLATSR